jgi:hypothetical protein
MGADLAPPSPSVQAVNVNMVGRSHNFPTISVVICARVLAVGGLTYTAVGILVNIQIIMYRCSVGISPTYTHKFNRVV